MFLGYQGDKVKFYTEQALDATLYNLTKVEETEDEYVLDGEEYVLKDAEWEEKQAQKEAERVAHLHLTRGDVFRALLLAKGVTRAQLRAIIEALPETNQEQAVTKEMALIDFDEALEFYRGNALIDTVGAQLGISAEQMTRFFETNDYHELVDEEEVVEEEK